MRPFRAYPDSTKKIAASATTARTALTTPPVGPTQVRVYNAGAVTAFVGFGGSSVVATLTTSIPLPAGGVEVYSTQENETYAAAITAADTADVYFTMGDGL
jgi:hypothetical protein